MSELFGIILWLVVNIRSSQYFSRSTPQLTLISYPRGQCLPSLLGSSHLSTVFTVVYLVSDLNQTIRPTMLPSSHPFFSTCSYTASPTYWEFWLRPFKNSIIVRYSECDVVFLCFAIYLQYNYCLNLYDI